MNNFDGRERSKSQLRVLSLRSVALLLLCGVAVFALYNLSRETAAPQRRQQPASSKQLWTCSMHPQVIQEGPGRCPICHMELTPLKVDGDEHAAANEHHESLGGIGKAAHTGRQPMSDMSSGEREVKYWWDPMMSPPFISDSPGKSPMGMDLVPVYEDESPVGAEVRIDPSIVQNMGVRTAVVRKGRLNQTIRLVGYLAEAQPNIREVNLRVSGWVKRLYANTEGMHVKEGSPLFDLYSPELSVAIEELNASRRAQAAFEGKDGASGKMASSAVKKLLRLGVSAAQIEGFRGQDNPPETITFTSPISGHVTEKHIVEGSAVKAGDTVLHIVDHSTLWIDAQAFERQIPHLNIGDGARATISAFPGEMFEGSIIFIHPHLDMMTRTTTVRFAVENKALRLRPGMFAAVKVFPADTRDSLLVPREAVIDTGMEQIVFVTHEEGHFEPRKVQMGGSGDDGIVQILSGLSEGEEVVTSGQFLLDSESRLREAVQKYLREKQVTSRGSDQG